MNKSTTSRPTSKFTPEPRRDGDGVERRTFYSTGHRPAMSVTTSVPTTDSDVFSRVSNTLEKEFDLNPSQILGSFAPDFILSKLQVRPPIMKTANTVCLMMDMSGFTALTEAYSLQGKGGTDKLSTTLSKVLVPLAERILTSRGDIVEFAGDAFIAYWIVESAARLPEVIQTVIDCALICQDKHGMYETDVQIVVRIKIGVSAGDSNILALGDNETSQFCIFGPSALTSAEAEGMASSGDVVVHPDAWQFCNPSDYKYTALKRGYVKVTGVLKYIEKSGAAKKLLVANKTRVSEVRPLLEHLAAGKIDEDQLRRYMIPAVLRKLDDQLPLDYVNETRIVTIVFVKLEIGSKLTDDELIFDVLQAAFLKIIYLARRKNGCLTKVILFDKGWTFLLAFGLPGQVQQNQGRNALKFSYRLKEALLQDKDIPEVSIGCTTGSVYCGIVGHPLRREYTMLGRAVNKAARIMCAYPGIVSCDADTMYRSKLPQYLFQQLERKPIKGFKNPGTMYEFLGQDASETASVRRYFFPLLGRQEELEVIKYAMASCTHDTRQALAPSPNVNARSSDSARKRKVQFGGGGGDDLDRKQEIRIQMIILEGSQGIGKTRLLSAAIATVQTSKRWNVAAHVAGQQSSENWIPPLRQLLTKALNMETIRTVRDREQYLTRVAKVNNDTELLSSICILNELFQINLPLTAKILSLKAEAVHKYTYFVLGQLLRYTNKDNFVLFAVQNAHFLHENTWQYLFSLSGLPFVFILMTLLRNPDGLPKISDTAMRICYHAVGVTTLKLEGIEEDYVVPLACQFLEVKAIPNGVEKILKDKCEGNPALVEVLLQELLRTDKIEIIEADAPAVRILRATLKYCDAKYLARSSDMEWYSSSFQFSSGDNTTDPRDESEIRPLMGVSSTGLSVVNDPLGRVCILKVKSVKDVAIESLHKETLLHDFDKLNSNEQMMLKCASILGRNFSREMLDYILPSYRGSSFKYLQSFCGLMEKNFLVCSFLVRGPQGEEDEAKGNRRKQRCACSKNIGVRLNLHQETVDETEDEEKDGGSALPSFARCSYPAFANANMVDVAFELLTTGQLVELSTRAIEYLDGSFTYCKACGGEDIRSKLGFDPENITFTYKETERSVFAEQKSLLKGLDGLDILATKNELSLKQKFLLVYAASVQDLDSYTEFRQGNKRVKQALEEKIESLRNGSLLDIDRDEVLLILDIFRALKDMREKYERPVLPKCKLCTRIKERPSEMIRRTRRGLYEQDEQYLPSAPLTQRSSLYDTRARSTSSKSEENPPSQSTPRASSAPAAMTRMLDGANENAGKAKAGGRNRGTIKRSAVVLDLDETVVEFTREVNADITLRGQKGTSKRSGRKSLLNLSGNDNSRRLSSSGDSRKRSTRRSTTQHSSQGSKSDRRKSTMLDGRLGIEALARLSTVIKPRRSLHSHQPGCKCDIIAAKVEFELSKHYKNAGQLEQSLGCLLCAIEFIINSGDTDDAFFLLLDLPDCFGNTKESVADDIHSMRRVTNPFFLAKATFLKGVANFHTGDNEQAKKYFTAIMKAVDVSIEKEQPPTWWEITVAKAKLWLHNRRSPLEWCKSKANTAFRRHHALPKTELTWSDMKVLSSAMVIITLAYLQEIHKLEGNNELCAALCMKQAIYAEASQAGMNILLPAYCNAMEGLAGAGRYGQVEEFEEKLLQIYNRFFAFNEILSLDEAVLTSHMFLSVATSRLLRGETRTAAESAYAALRVASFLHSPQLICHIFPVLLRSLMYLMKIRETVEALQQLWYYAEEEEDDIAMGIYICTNLDLILDCGCTVEPFYYCERFVSSRKWRKRMGTYRELEIQYNLETSVALWFARHSKWGIARIWMDLAWRKIPKTKSFHTISGDLKLFQCFLLLRFYHLSRKNLDNFQSDWNKALELRRSLKASVTGVPVLLPRFHHLHSYYFKLLKLDPKSGVELKKGYNIAEKHNNRLEMSFIEHTRLVWEDRCLPSVEYYWLDHSDQDNIDWHEVERMPAANIMYTLPIREDEDNFGEEIDV